MTARPSDDKQRQAARLRLDANVVVEAGAGTGKTTLLTDRILFLLLGRAKAAPIGSLVALTFTEKAAGEIKLRLTDRLVELVAVLSGGVAAPRAAAFLEELRAAFPQAAPRALERARSALEDMDKAQIGTIHSFASHLLRLYPVQAGVDPGFRVDEGDSFEELFSSEWARWLDSELGEAPPRREDWLALLRLVALEDLEAMAGRLCAEGLELGSAGQTDAETSRWLKEAAGRLRKAHEGQPKPRGNSKILQSLQRLADHTEALGRAAGQAAPALPNEWRVSEVNKSAWPSTWEEGEVKLYLEMLDLAKRCSEGNEALVRAAFVLLKPFARAFRALYTRSGLVSFDGLLRKARDLVRDHPDVRAELKGRYGALLIDEFQDIDPLQGELLLFLAEEEGGRASDWRRVKLGAGRLFVVGDPKQSIYRFRGADIAAYQDFTARILESGQAFSCDLTTNFRSHAGLVGPVNAIFAKTMVYEEGSQPAYKAIDAHGRAQPEGPAVEVVCVGPGEGSREKPDAAAVQRTEAAWAAAWVAEHCGKGRYRHKDVAVLLRSAGALGPLLEAFKGSGIPYAVEMERFFYGAAEVLDLLNLLRALDDPGDRLALAGLLRSPLVALEDGELYRLARTAKLSYLRAPGPGLAPAAAARLGAFYSRLRSLRQRVGRLPLGELVHAVLEETALLETAAWAYHGQQTVSNLLKFGRMASSASDERGTTLKEFIHTIESAMLQAKQEGESPLADEHLDAVRILSIHKSKGLEFPVVMLMNLSGKRGGAGREPEVLTDWKTGFTGLGLAGRADAVLGRLALREKARQEDETTRLLYVALTRAKEKLLLLGGETGDSTSLSRRLEEGGGWPLPGADSLELGGVKAAVWRLPAGPGGASRGRAGPVQALEPVFPMPSGEDLAALWSRRSKVRDEALSKSWTTSPTAYLRPMDENEASRGSATGALVGQVCHRVLQFWDFNGAAALAEAVKALCAALSSARPGADWLGVEKEASEVLAGFLSSKAAAGLAGVEILGREIPILTAQGGTVVRGSIDLLYRHEGRVVVADYKTDRIRPGDQKAVLEKYAPQGAAYCRAVEKALGLSDVSFRLIFLR